MFSNVRVISVVAILVLTACAPVVPLQRDQTASLTKGASIHDIEKNLGKATVALSYEFDSNGNRYLANHYDLQTGTRQEMGMMCTPVCIPYPIYIPVTAAYVMIYDAMSKQLFAWGMVEELSRSPDEGVSAIMPDLKKSYDIELAKKKK